MRHSKAYRALAKQIFLSEDIKDHLQPFRLGKELLSARVEPHPSELLMSPIVQAQAATTQT
jgi:hypothetical protein